MAHFYENKSGEIIPRHFVPMASRPGESRPTRITDARKAGWYPSVTTIQGLLDKPALTDWKIQEHLKQAFRLAQESDMRPLEEWISLVKQETQATLEKAPKDGTDFHDVLERWFKDAKVSDENEPIVQGVQGCLFTNIGREDWVSEKSFVNGMGFAGKVDLHYPRDSASLGWVIDFKTKNTKDKWKPGKMAYPEMAMQLAAYRVGLGLDNARCANVFVCIPTGEVEFHEWGPNELDREFANFSDLLRIWLRNAMYIPGKPQ